MENDQHPASHPGIAAYLGDAKGRLLMQYRQFGRTGWQVSEIAFGAWQLGGDWGAVDDTASIRTLHHAFERGVNFVDTAYI
jgi:diketogulonate reductase-like aldo/keto reductase